VALTHNYIYSELKTFIRSDLKTEAKIYEKLFRHYSDRAIVSALHRMHLLPMFDYIYVMENGAVDDHGTFTHLRTNSAVFREHWKHLERDSPVN